MIWESYYWKADLLKQAAELRKRVSQKRWTDVSLARCEQTIMVGFYSIRKLVESRKLTDRASAKAFDVRSYSATGKAVTLRNNHKIDLLYDLDHPKSRTVKLSFLCNQVIHSYVFSLVFEERTLSAAMVASDYQKSTALIEIPITSVIEAFTMVGEDDVTSMTYTFDATKGDYLVQAD